MPRAGKHGRTKERMTKFTIRRQEQPRNVAAAIENCVPSSVRAIDAFLNHRVATAGNSHELHEWMRVKTAVKRRLVDTPWALLDAAAKAELSALQESV